MSLLRIAESAEYLNTSERFVRRLIFERRIPYAKIGVHVRIDSRNLDAFIKAGRVEARPARNLCAVKGGGRL